MVVRCQSMLMRRFCTLQDKQSARDILVRRDILASTISAVVCAVLPKKGYAQAGIIALLWDLPWGTILTGVANALIIIDYLNKYVLGEPPLPAPQPPRICKISLQDFGALHLQCRTLAMSLESLNYEPVVENGDDGAIPALNAYAQHPDIAHWRRAREALAQLLLNAQAMLASVAHITGPDMAWSSVGVPLSGDHIETVTIALNSIEPTLAQFDQKANARSRVSQNDVQYLLKQLAPLPQIAANALDSIQSLQDARQKAVCP